MSASIRPILLWLRNDLRLADHPAATHAARLGPVLPVFVWDERWLGSSAHGLPRLGPHRAAFIRQSLAALRAQGLPVAERSGSPPAVVAELAQRQGAAAVVTHAEPAPYERADEGLLEARLSEHGIPLTRVAGNALFEPDDLPFPEGQVPELFTDFRKAVERSVLVRRPLPAFSWAPLPEQLLVEADASPAPVLPEPVGELLFAGGAAAAHERMQHWLWREDRLRRYKDTRDGLLGLDYSSKLSPWLAAGCLSPRELWHETLRYEETRLANESTYWLRVELLWREFFRLQIAKHGAAFFRAEGPARVPFPWRSDAALFEAWASGQTGYPIIDAALRELSATGYLGNRARQLAASFFTKNLGLDWRLGAALFESRLVDYDVCSNWGNWAYAAGVGQDARGFRYFHLPKQAADHDPDGAYVKHWCPELSALPKAKVHEPHRLTPDEQRRYGVSIGRDYPAPIVDLEASARANEAAYLIARADPLRRKGNYRLQRALQQRKPR